MKYHKIRGVAKEVCTAEQMVAYNYASRYARTWLNTYKKCKSEIARGDFLWDLQRLMIADWKKNYDKYNIDAIDCALGAGLHEYMDAGCPILWHYEDVGKMFPALYLNIE